MCFIVRHSYWVGQTKAFIMNRLFLLSHAPVTVPGQQFQEIFELTITWSSERDQPTDSRRFLRFLREPLRSCVPQNYKHSRISAECTTKVPKTEHTNLGPWAILPGRVSSLLYWIAWLRCSRCFTACFFDFFVNFSPRILLEFAH